MNWRQTHINREIGLSFPHLMLGTTEKDYKVALMVLHNNNSLTLKELKSMICLSEAEETKRNEIDHDSLSIRSGITYGEDNDITFSDESITPCALNYEEDGRSYLTRLDKQMKSFLSPETQRLHRDLQNNCAESVCMPTMVSLNQSRKNMLENIDYVKTFCDVEHNPRVARIWAEMEQYLDMKKNEARDILAKDTRIDSQEVHGKIVMSGIRMKKKAPEARLKGVSG